jgi:hypothetical protein
MLIIASNVIGSLRYEISQVASYKLDLWLGNPCARNKRFDPARERLNHSFLPTHYLPDWNHCEYIR